MRPHDKFHFVSAPGSRCFYVPLPAVHFLAGRCFLCWQVLPLFAVATLARSVFPCPQLLPDAAALSSMQGLPWSGNSSAQTSASLHPPAALRLRVLPFTRTWSSTVCAEEFPTPLEMSLHGLPLLRYSKSIGTSAPIAYATSVSPPGEAVAWPGTQVFGAG